MGRGCWPSRPGSRGPGGSTSQEVSDMRRTAGPSLVLFRKTGARVTTTAAGSSGALRGSREGGCGLDDALEV